MPSMMRSLLHRRYWQRVQDRRSRLKAGVAAQWWEARHPAFIDYHPDVPSTLPEKMVFEGLVDRGVNFAFSWLFGDYPQTAEKEERLRPDFYLYDLGVIIEIAGWYWHTRPGMYEHDIMKHFVLTAAGYKTYILTDIDIMTKGVEAVLDTIPELAGFRRQQPSTILIGPERFDPKASIRSRLQKWPKQNVSRWKDTMYGKVGVDSWWQAPQRAPRRPSAELAYPFTQDLIKEGLDELYEVFGGNFTKWMEHLTDRFIDIDDPEDWSFLYWYWATWVNTGLYKIQDLTWNISLPGGN